MPVLGSKVHSVVPLKIGDESTIVVVLEDGNAHWFDFSRMEWNTMGMVPDGIAYETFNAELRKHDKRTTAKKRG